MSTRQRVSFLIFAGLLWLAGFDVMSYAATITWTNAHLGGATLAVDSRGEPLWGTSEFGAQQDLSLGALVQLWKAVGEIDDPAGNPDAYRDLNWHVDDIFLDETHIGFGTWSYANGGWSRRGDYRLNENDIFYVRAYNVSKPDFASTPIMERELTIRNREGEIVFERARGISVQTYFFDNLQTRPIPEPSALLIVLPAMALAGMKRKKARLRVERKQEVS